MWDRWGEKKDVGPICEEYDKIGRRRYRFPHWFLRRKQKPWHVDYVEKVNYRINLKNIEHFVDIKSIEPRARKILISAEYNDLEGRQKRAVEAFLNACDGKKDDDDF